MLEPVNHTDRNLSGRFLRQDVVAKLNKGSFDALPLAGTSPAEIQQEAAKLQCDYILFTDITEVKTSKPGGIGGAMKKVSGGGDNKDKQDVKLDYKLFAVDAAQSPKFTGKAQASTGGFGVGSALKMAAFAGQMYMSVMTVSIGVAAFPEHGDDFVKVRQTANFAEHRAKKAGGNCVIVADVPESA